MNRVAAAVVSIALIGATASPVLRGPRDDGFPLSTYPMFATRRPTTLTLDYVVGVTSSGERRTLTPALVGSGEVLQALTIIAQASASHRLPALCHQIAGRVAADPAQREVAAIRIVTGTHDAVEYLVRHHQGPEVERATCAVPR